MNGKIYLIPVPLADTPHSHVLPDHNLEIVRNIRHFIVENVRSARRFLRKADPAFDIDGSSFTVLDSETPPADVPPMVAPALEGKDIGIISEAGCPAIADPGSALVAVAQKKGIEVIPLVGPSSIIMSLMASGFNGQSFTFNGYLPIDRTCRAETIRRLEKLSAAHRQTQIFIETPYRNNAMLRALTETLRPSTLICVAADITGSGQKIRTMSSAEWSRQKYDYDKIPAIFLIHVPEN